MNRLDTFKNRHRGERGVIVANGPSLNQMDLSFLKYERVIGLNKIYLGFSRFCFYPRYLVMVNKKVIEQSASVLPTISCVKFIGERGADLVPLDPLTHHIKTKNVSQRFSTDITSGVNEGWTVTYAALQIAFFLGFSEIVIIGMDHRFEYVGHPNESNIIQGQDPNHFSPSYFGGGQSWDNPDLVKSEESYRIARAEFERDGRRIIDATVNGACLVFEKADYRCLFRGSSSGAENYITV